MWHGWCVGGCGLTQSLRKLTNYKWFVIWFKRGETNKDHASGFRLFLFFIQISRLSWSHNQCAMSLGKNKVATYHIYTHTDTKTPGLHLLFTVHCVNAVPSEAASQQQDVVVRHVLAQQHPLPMSLINSSAVSLSSCPSNRGIRTHTRAHIDTLAQQHHHLLMWHITTVSYSA